MLHIKEVHMEKILTGLQDLLTEELKKIVDKGDLNSAELDNVKDALCSIKETLEIEDMMSGGYSNASYGHMPRTYNIRGSYRRGRDANTGRYMSMRGSEEGYSGHSIKDRMIARLEGMYDEAGSEHERQMINDWIGRLETE